MGFTVIREACLLWHQASGGYRGERLPYLSLPFARMANLPWGQGVAAPVTVTDESDIAQHAPFVESSGEAAQNRQFWQIVVSLPGVRSAPSSSTARNCHSLLVWVYVENACSLLCPVRLRVVRGSIPQSRLKRVAYV